MEVPTEVEDELLDGHQLLNQVDDDVALLHGLALFNVDTPKAFFTFLVYFIVHAHLLEETVVVVACLFQPQFCRQFSVVGVVPGQKYFLIEDGAVGAVGIH